MIQPAVRASTFSLEDCVAYALGQNLELRDAELAADQAATQVMRARGVYDPVLRLQALHEDAELSTGPISSEGGSETTMGDVRFAERFRYGTDVALVARSRRNTFESSTPGLFSFPEYQSYAGIEVGQSLWRNRGGRQDRAVLEQAAYAAEAARWSIDRRREEIASSVGSLWWDAAAAVHVYESRKRAVERLSEQLKVNRARVEDGLLDETEILEAEAAIAVTEVDVIRARHDVARIEDQLKNRMNLAREDWDRVSFRYPPASDMARVMEDVPPVFEAFATAIGQRDDLQVFDMRIRSIDAEIAVADDEIRPDARIEGSYALGDDADAWADSLAFNKSNWSIGATLELPFGRRAPRAERMRLELEKARIRNEANLLEQSIFVECRRAIRNLDTTTEAVAATLKAMQLQKRKLELEREEFDRGKSSTRFLVDFENDFEFAELDAIVARTEYEKALLDLATATGTLFDRIGGAW